LLVTILSTPSTRRAVVTVGRRDLVQQTALALLSHVVFLGGVFLAAGHGLDAGLSALVCALQPLLVTAAGWLAFSDRVDVRQWTGLLVAL
ncbi:EamA/RhaT family transporter, partial [Xanthomonas citri pv. citri]|nr:EamA/RhaT family transporter [Xanthomonas citri pv. citri]